MPKNWKLKFKNSKILANNWVVTLTATLVGVFLALYLNESIASRKLNQKKSIAIENILLEIKENQKVLEKNIKMREPFIEVFSFFENHKDEKDRLIVSVDSMYYFKSKHPGIFIITDSMTLDNGMYHYKVEMDSNFDLSHFNLTTIAWETLKNSGLGTSYDFGCLMTLERMNKFTNETIQQEKNLVEFLKPQEQFEEEDIVAQLKLLVGYEKALLKGYESIEKELRNCN